MKRFATIPAIATISLTALLATALPANAEEPVQAINPPYSTSTEQPVGGVTPPAYVLIKATDLGLDVTSPVYTDNSNGLQWVETTTGILVANPDDVIYAATTIPSTGERAVAAPLEAKVVSATPKAGAFYVKGAIKTTYYANGHVNAFGNSITGEQAISGGVKQSTQIGSTGKITDFYWSSSTGARYVANSIRAKVNSVNPAGTLTTTGFPTTQEVQTSTGAYQKFQKGTMTYTKGVGTTWKAGV